MFKALNRALKPKLKPGMGPISHEKGTTFRVWAPNAQKAVSYTHLDVYKRQVEEVGLLIGHVAGQPRRRADVEVGLEVAHRAGADGGRVHVGCANDDRDAGRQPQLGGHVRPQRAEDVDGPPQIGQLGPVNR